MNKTELVDKVHQNEQLGCESKSHAERIVTAVIDAIKAGLADEPHKVQLVGFGSFSVRQRAARKGRNPQTGAAIEIPASSTVAFTPGTALKDLVNAKKGGAKAAAPKAPKAAKGAKKKTK